MAPRRGSPLTLADIDFFHGQRLGWAGLSKFFYHRLRAAYRTPRPAPPLPPAPAPNPAATLVTRLAEPTLPHQPDFMFCLPYTSWLKCTSTCACPWTTMHQMRCTV